MRVLVKDVRARLPSRKFVNFKANLIGYELDYKN